MGLEGWYYMHKNGEMIYKRELGGTAADILLTRWLAVV